MKILGILPLYPPRSQVGAWISTHECLAHMARRGHEVHVVAVLSRAAEYEHDGVLVHPKWKLNRCASDADVVVSHLGDRGVGAKWAKRVGAASVRMVHGQDKAAADFLAEGPTDLVVWNSSATAATVPWFGRAITVHPPIRPAAYRCKPGRAHTLVNLSKPKGAETFWHLTEALPGFDFLGVLGGYGVQHLPTEVEARMMCGEERTGNVTIWHPRTDARDIYRRTGVLLMPSETETYGRVGVEAMCAGIPVVAHPSPGLCEALGDAAVWCDRDDHDAWVGALRRLADPTEWAIRSAWSSEHVRDLDPSAELDLFADSVEALTVKAAA